MRRGRQKSTRLRARGMYNSYLLISGTLVARFLGLGFSTARQVLPHIRPSANDAHRSFGSRLPIGYGHADMIIDRGALSPVPTAADLATETSQLIQHHRLVLHLFHRDVNEFVARCRPQGRMVDCRPESAQYGTRPIQMPLGLPLNLGNQPKISLHFSSLATAVRYSTEVGTIDVSYIFSRLFMAFHEVSISVSVSQGDSHSSQDQEDGPHPLVISSVACSSFDHQVIQHLSTLKAGAASSKRNFSPNSASHQQACQ
jgi:hypothetical protein